MDEGFDVEAVDIGSTDVDVPEITIEPLDIADEAALEPIMETPELVELEQQAEALEIEPFDDGIDIGFDWDEAVQEANEAWAAEAAEQTCEPSAISNIINAGAEGATSPSGLAEIGGALTPSGTEGVVSQGLQAGWDMGVTGSSEFMDATIRQHGASPSVELQNLQIQQAIEEGASAAAMCDSAPVADMAPMMMKTVDVSK